MFDLQLFQRPQPPSTYEPQLQVDHQRMCGAAALVMAFRRYGIEVAQEKVWPAISRKHAGYQRAHTYLMAQAAIARGLIATILQTHRPWDTLKTCWQHNLTAIVNHRMHENSSDGHYSLLGRVTSDHLELYDPWQGPQTRLGRKQFLRLWLPTSDTDEISGNVLLCISTAEQQRGLWCHCNRLIDRTIRCKECRQSFEIGATEALGCWNWTCFERRWLRIFCPYCDHAFGGPGDS